MASEQSAGGTRDAGEGPVFLVVDDDPMVRKIVTRGLSQLNPAEVLEEEDGLAAQEVLRDKKVDVVVTDVVMPNMGGFELGVELRARQPDLPLLLMSGYAAEAPPAELEDVKWLAKPFHRDQLVAKIEQVMSVVDA